MRSSLEVAEGFAGLIERKNLMDVKGDYTVFDQLRELG